MNYSAKPLFCPPRGLKSLVGLWIFCWFFVAASPSAPLVRAQPVFPDTLAADVQVSLLTRGPGLRYVYEGFGHSCIRIYSPTQALDIIFDFGNFDLSAPNFYLNYLLGDLRYLTSAGSTKRYMERVQRKGHSLREQILRITEKEKRNIYAHLLELYGDGRQSFSYDYFYYNCSTRPYEVLKSQIHALKPPNTFPHPAGSADKAHTFRDLIRTSLEQFPWNRLIIELALGAELEVKLSPEAYLFLPAYLGDYMAAHGKEVVSKDLLLLKERPHSPPPSINPVVITMAWVLLIFFLLSHVGNSRQKRYYWLDALWLFCVGLLGCALSFLWIGTSHHSTWNIDLLWAWPTHLFMAFALFFAKGRRFFHYYLLAYGGTLGVLFLFDPLLPYRIPKEMWPLWLAFLLRVFHHLRLDRQVKKETAHQALQNKLYEAKEEPAR